MQRKYGVSVRVGFGVKDCRGSGRRRIFPFSRGDIVELVAVI